jgi:hypothetical protein
MPDDPLSLLSLGIWLFAAGMWPVGFLFGACSACCNECVPAVAFERCLKMTPVNPPTLVHPVPLPFDPNEKFTYQISDRPSSAYRVRVRKNVLDAGVFRRIGNSLESYDSPTEVNGTIRISLSSAGSSRTPPGETRTQVWRFLDSRLLESAAGSFSAATPQGVTPPWHLQVDLTVTGVIEEQDVIDAFSEYGSSIGEIRESLEALPEALQSFEDLLAQVEPPSIESVVGQDEHGQVKLVILIKQGRSTETHDVPVTIFPTGRQRTALFFPDPLTSLAIPSSASAARESGPSVSGWSVTRRPGVTVLSRELLVVVKGFSHQMENGLLRSSDVVEFNVNHTIYNSAAAAAFIRGDAAAVVSVRARILAGHIFLPPSGGEGAVQTFDVEYQLDPLTFLCGVDLSLSNGVSLGILPATIGLSGCSQLIFQGVDPTLAPDAVSQFQHPCHDVLTMFPVSGGWARQVYGRNGVFFEFQPGFLGLPPFQETRQVFVSDFYGVGCQVITAMEEGPLRTAAESRFVSGGWHPTNLSLPALLNDPGELMSGPTTFNNDFFTFPSEDRLPVCEEPSYGQEPLFKCSAFATQVIGPYIPPVTSLSEERVTISISRSCTGLPPPVLNLPLGYRHYQAGNLYLPDGFSDQQLGVEDQRQPIGPYPQDGTFVIDDFIGFTYPTFVPLNPETDRIDGLTEYEFPGRVRAADCRLRVTNGLTNDEPTVRLDSFGPTSWATIAPSSSRAPGDGIALVTSSAPPLGSCTYFGIKHGKDNFDGSYFLHCCNLQVTLLNASPTNRRGAASQIAEVALTPADDKNGGELIRLRFKRQWRGGEGIVLKFTCGSQVAFRELRKRPTPAGIVAGLGATRLPCGTVSLAWGYPEDDGGSDITSYRVEFRRIGESDWAFHETTSATNSVVTGLIGAGYQFRVRANHFYALGEWAEVEVDRIGVPSDLTFVRDPCDAVLLSWTPPPQSECVAVAEYLVQFRTAGTGTYQTFASVAGATTTATVTGLSATTGYEFRIGRVVSENDVAFSSPLAVDGCPPEQ